MTHTTADILEFMDRVGLDRYELFVGRYESEFDTIGTLQTLVETIDDPEFDAADAECIRDLVQYISVQCRAVCGSSSQ